MSDTTDMQQPPVDPLGIPMPTGGGVSQDFPYRPEPRYAIVNGKRVMYDGPGVVDANGQFALKDANGNPTYYDLQNDPTQIYYGMGDEQREMLLDILERKNMNVSNPNAAINAITNLLETANIMGRTWEVALRMVDQQFPDASRSAAAPRFRVSAAADIRSVANEVAKRTLGRQFTDDEVQRFVTSYQQSEMRFQQQTAGVVEAPPSADVAAEQFAQQVAPTEANAYKYLGAVDMLMKNLGQV
jgi:hypothetical protein